MNHKMRKAPRKKLPPVQLNTFKMINNSTIVSKNEQDSQCCGLEGLL